MRPWAIYGLEYCMLVTKNDKRKTKKNKQRKRPIPVQFCTTTSTVIRVSAYTDTFIRVGLSIHSCTQHSYIHNDSRKSICFGFVQIKTRSFILNIFPHCKKKTKTPFDGDRISTHIHTDWHALAAWIWTRNILMRNAPNLLPAFYINEYTRRRNFLVKKAKFCTERFFICGFWAVCERVSIASAYTVEKLPTNVFPLHRQNAHKNDCAVEKTRRQWKDIFEGMVREIFTLASNDNGNYLNMRTFLVLEIVNFLNIWQMLTRIPILITNQI